MAMIDDVEKLQRVNKTLADDLAKAEALINELRDDLSATRRLLSLSQIQREHYYKLAEKRRGFETEMERIYTVALWGCYPQKSDVYGREQSQAHALRDIWNISQVILEKP